MANYLGRSWTRRDLLARVGSVNQLAGVQALEATDGLGRGVRLFEVRTGGGLTFTVLEDRALDIGTMSYQGVPLTWASPSGLVHPSYYEPAQKGWVRSFGGGLVATCGLDQFGAPAVEAGEAFGLHGRVGNLPAHEVAYENFWQGDEYVMKIKGKVRQAALFGEHLVLERTLETRLGSTTITLEDTVTNESFRPQPHMLLYHCNFGFPLISEDTLLEIPAAETQARDVDSEQELASWGQITAPTNDFGEQVFQHTVMTNADGWATLTINNPVLGKGVRLKYDTTTLPHLFQWKKPTQGTYAFSLEPANANGIGGRTSARETGNLPQLDAGESRRYALTFEVFSDT